MKKKQKIIISILLAIFVLFVQKLYIPGDIYAADKSGIKPESPKVIDSGESSKEYNNKSKLRSISKSLIEIYSEIEQRIKNALLSGINEIDISDMNLNSNDVCLNYYYAQEKIDEQDGAGG